MTWPIVSAGMHYNIPSTAYWRNKCSTVPRLPISQASPVNVGGDTWRMDVPGIYYWNDKNLQEIVLVAPQSSFFKAKLAFDFIVACTYYLNSPTDSASHNSDPEEFTRDMFFDPGVFDLGCGQRASSMAIILEQMGVDCRTVQWLGLEPVQGGHLSCEVMTEEGWTCFDPFYGQIWQSGWDAIDLLNSMIAGNPCTSRMVYFQETMEGLNWTRNIPTHLIYEEYQGGLGWGTIDAEHTYPLYINPLTTLEEMTLRLGGGNTVQWTEQQCRDYWYAEEV